MTRNAVIAAVVLVLLIMFAPVVLADGIERFFAGLGAMMNAWSK